MTDKCNNILGTTCGPAGFNKLTIDILENIGLNKNNIFKF